jgi:hypothetical protein
MAGGAVEALGRGGEELFGEVVGGGSGDVAGLDGLRSDGVSRHKAKQEEKGKDGVARETGYGLQTGLLSDDCCSCILKGEHTPRG